jgi:hypothetical protein
VRWDQPISLCRNTFTKCCEHLNRGSARISGADSCRCARIIARVIVLDTGSPADRLTAKSFLILFTMATGQFT